MDSFKYDELKPLQVNAPEGMYGQVRERLIHERIRIAKTMQQLTFGAALLLIVGVVNIATVFYFNKKTPLIASGNAEQILFETYFDNQIISPK
jgi:hypothetical protein